MNLRSLAKWSVVLFIFVALGRMVWENWTQVKEAPFAFRLAPLSLSVLVYALSYFIQIGVWYLITLKLNIPLSFRETTETWFYSQWGKYLPGKVWIFLGRIYLYESRGASKKRVVVALYLETVTLIAAAGLIFFTSLFFYREVRLTPVEDLIPLGSLLSVLALFSLHPRVLQTLLNGGLRLLKREPISLSFSYPDILRVLLGSVLVWLVGGFGFYLFMDSVYPIPSVHVPYLLGALAVSTTLGLLALFAPSGLGVREGVLVYLLSAIMPISVAVVLSVLTRLWMTFIEIGLIGVVYLMGRFKRRIKG